VLRQGNINSLLCSTVSLHSTSEGVRFLTLCVVAAQAQRGALEESFAQGKRNKKEAGSKYGW